MSLRSSASHLNHVLVAIDGRVGGDRALDFAVSLARGYESRLTICAVAAPEGAAATEARLGRARRVATDAGIFAATLVLEGPPGDAIAACIASHDYDAAVVAARDRDDLAGERFGGSVADRVVRRSDIPVFVVPGQTDAAPKALRSLLVAVDASDSSDTAVAFAIELAATSRAALTLCAVAEIGGMLASALACAYDVEAMASEMRLEADGFLSAPGARARARGIVVDAVTAVGEPAEQILIATRGRPYQLVVIGTHGRRGVRRLLLGSVAERVIRGSDVPVVVVRASRRKRFSFRDSVAGAPALHPA